MRVKVHDTKSMTGGMMIWSKSKLLAGALRPSVSAVVSGARRRPATQDINDIPMSLVDRRIW